MAFSIFISFDGNCREAVTYYADVFEQDEPMILSYGDVPASEGMPVLEEEKNLVMYTELNISGGTVMFMDVSKGFDLVAGNNISPSVTSTDRKQVETIFNKLKADGQVGMELQQTFWSPLYGIVEDKFGISWQISYDDGTEFTF